MLLNYGLVFFWSARLALLLSMDRWESLQGKLLESVRA